MPTTILTSRQFNHDTGRAKRAAEKGPVFITHRGERSHVLLSIDEYERLTGRGKSLVEMLSMPGADEVEFEPARLEGSLIRPADLD